MALPPGLSLTYLGHSTFVVQIPNGKRLLFDPFLAGNPSCPSEYKDPASLAPIDLLLISHSHNDHFSDAIKSAKTLACPVVANFEILMYMAKNGVEKIQPMNKGGTIALPDLGVTITLTHAFHSSSIDTGDGTIYGGEPCGIVVTLDDGSAFYFAGDTALFSDMALISELYAPKLAFLPIGDRFTMGPKEAAKALEFLSTVETVVPMHYGTFGLLSGTP
jgi:L-ascorbate metabolism protein UlaG (beta-lactamase superfamily)